MAGADGSPGQGAGAARRWDVALSFAGAQRGYVGQVAAALKARGVRCFYDADEQVRLWGTNLAEELPRIYAQESAAVVVFVSADYAGGDWTRLERRAAFSRAVAEAGVYVLPARFDDSELPGLLPDVVAVDLTRCSPGQFADLVVAKLADLAISASSPPAQAAGGPPGSVRVAEANLRRLGVHAAVSVPGVHDGEPPEYVPRDADAGRNGVRAAVSAAAAQGGFVLLVGGSSVGKTRCAAEAVKALLPDWRLAHPASPAELATLAVAPPERTVVWLDELQRYLDGERGLTGGVVRALLGAPSPVVIISTLWPEWYITYTAMPIPGEADPLAREREVLDLATVVRIGGTFSRAEQDRARIAATRDARLKAALSAARYGLTQTLAGAPLLVARWEDAQVANPYAWAVLTAVLDAARLGALTPLTAGFLRAAAPGYCTSDQQAEAPADWFDRALAYATAKLHGIAALVPAGAGMGQIAGYTVADYLLQHGSRERRSVRVPATTWDALLTHVRDPADAARLAGSAHRRLLFRYAIPLYRHAADTGYEPAAERLAGLLAMRGDLDQLRTRADAGDEPAARRLADLLARRPDLDQLRARASAGDGQAAARLADLLAEMGSVGEAEQILRDRAGLGDGLAAERLAILLARRQDLDQLRALADAGDEPAARRLADLLAELGQLDQLRARASADDRYAAEWLASLLTERGDLDEAEMVLRDRANAGDGNASERLADLLANRKDMDQLRARADAGDGASASRLAGLLAELKDAEEPRVRTDGGDQGEAEQILRDRADAGDRTAARRLADLLAERGDRDQLRDRADTGDEYAARELAGLLAEDGNLDELRDRADAGDEHAAGRLADLLAERGDLDQLRVRAGADDWYATSRLARLQVERGRLDEAEQILRHRAVVRHGDARRLAELLRRRGRQEEAEQLRRFGLNPDGSTASG